MLFELNNNYDMNLDYFNLNKYDKENLNKKNYNFNYNKIDNKNNDIDLENGYYLGNLFTNT